MFPFGKPNFSILVGTILDLNHQWPKKYFIKYQLIFSVYPALAAVGYVAILAMKIADDKRKEEERKNKE